MGRIAEILGDLILLMRSFDVNIIRAIGPPLAQLTSNLLTTAIALSSMMLTVGAFLAGGLAYSIFAITHVTSLSVLTRKGRLFISYEHSQLERVEVIERVLAAAQIEARKLPYSPEADHDKLLEQVQCAIRWSDMMICMPGRDESFVEHEVAMGFTLNKPMIFILNSQERPKIPNTAKHGYPVFDEKKLDFAGIHVLSEFISFIASGRRSTNLLYRSVLWNMLRSWKFIGIFILFTNLAVAMIGSIQSNPSWVDAKFAGYIPFDRNGSMMFIATFAAFFLFMAIHFGHFSSRTRLRNSISDVIANRSFDLDYLPEIIDFGFSRLDLNNILWEGAVIARHEMTGVKPANDLIARTNVAKIVLVWIFSLFIVLVFASGIYLEDLNKDEARKRYHSTSGEDVEQLMNERILAIKSVDQGSDYEQCNYKDWNGVLYYLRNLVQGTITYISRIASGYVFLPLCISAISIAILAFCLSPWRAKIIVSSNSVAIHYGSRSFSRISFKDLEKVEYNARYQTLHIYPAARSKPILVWTGLLRPTGHEIYAEISRRLLRQGAQQI